MTSKYLTNCKTYLAAAAIASFGVLGMAGLAQPAGAAPLNPPDTANLIITKLADSSLTGTLPNDGTAQNVSSYTHLDGVTFVAKRVGNLDLGSEQGWIDANKLSTAYNAANIGSPAAAEAFFASYDPDGAGPLPAGYYTLTTAGTHVTGELAGTADDGIATFANLARGFYLVEETDAPSNIIPSAPFVVGLPMTDPGGTGWMSDVYAYPKNKVKSITKDVEDHDAYKIGDQITWTITSPIPPSVDPGDEVTAYLVKDVLDSKLTYSATTPATAVLSGTFTGPQLTGTGATPDYVVEFSGASAPGTPPPPNTVRVRFTPAGLAKLSANRDAQVVVTIPTRVNAVGEIANSATVFDNENDATSETGGTDTPTPEETKFGAVRIHKVDDQGQGLQFAKFEIYRSEADAVAGTNPITIDDGINPPESVWESDAQGYLTISGLRYSSWVDGQDLTDPDGTLTPGDATDDMHSYWLVEVQAPSGYALISTPIRVNVVSVAGLPGTDGDKSILNAKSNGGWTLPLTGGSGSTLIYVAGLGLLGSAGAVALVRRRRSDEPTSA